MKDYPVTNLIKVSKLLKTWLIDIDGTIVNHNGYLNENEKVIEISRKFISRVSEKDRIILLTSRSIKYKDITESFLKKNSIRFDFIIYDLPMGERILINDIKPQGLKTAIAINVKRDQGINCFAEEDESL